MKLRVECLANMHIVILRSGGKSLFFCGLLPSASPHHSKYSTSQWLMPHVKTCWQQTMSPSETLYSNNSEIEKERGMYDILYFNDKFRLSSRSYTTYSFTSDHLTWVIQRLTQIWREQGDSRVYIVMSPFQDKYQTKWLNLNNILFCFKCLWWSTYTCRP